MVQTTNNIIDNTSNTLSIQVSLNGLSFCTIDSENQVTAIEQDNFGIRLTPEQVLDKIKYTFDNNPILKSDFKIIEVIYHNDLYSLVPKPLFDSNAIKLYLQYNIKVLATDFIVYDELEQHDMVSVYIPYANINNFFFDTFGSFTYKHASTILVNSLLAQEKNNDGTNVFVNMNDTCFDLIIIGKGKLILANTYHHETKEDFLYYLLFAIEQLKLNPEELKLFFLGDITTESEYYTITYKYIRNVGFGKHYKEPKLSPNISTIKPHEHFILLSHF
ncbi:DUF3822 family protein [Aquimarina sp. AU474]|uniref:DUF3822 family protein n=1 Tax=Aquimarina sp. AU474 TaxID=2108529 RepID=UPI000D69E336|nr:DUF3822 family protein [Aquimarina sp. AU474]